MRCAVRTAEGRNATVHDFGHSLGILTTQLGGRIKLYWQPGSWCCHGLLVHACKVVCLWQDAVPGVVVVYLCLCAVLSMAGAVPAQCTAAAAAATEEVVLAFRILAVAWPHHRLHLRPHLGPPPVTTLGHGGCLPQVDWRYRSTTDALVAAFRILLPHFAARSRQL